MHKLALEVTKSVQLIVSQFTKENCSPDLVSVGMSPVGINGARRSFTHSLPREQCAMILAETNHQQNKLSREEVPGAFFLYHGCGSAVPSV